MQINKKHCNEGRIIKTVRGLNLGSPHPCHTDLSHWTDFATWPVWDISQNPVHLEQLLQNQDRLNSILISKTWEGSPIIHPLLKIVPCLPKSPGPPVGAGPGGSFWGRGSVRLRRLRLPLLSLVKVSWSLAWRLKTSAVTQFSELAFKVPALDRNVFLVH